MECRNHLDQSFLIVHLDCFQVLAIINESAMNILCINVCLFLAISLGLIPVIEDMILEKPDAFQKVCINLPSLRINVNAGFCANLIISLINSLVYFIFCWECYKGVLCWFWLALSVFSRHLFFVYCVLGTYSCVLLALGLGRWRHWMRENRASETHYYLIHVLSLVVNKSFNFSALVLSTVNSDKSNICMFWIFYG